MASAFDGKEREGGKEGGREVRQWRRIMREEDVGRAAEAEAND